MSKILLVFSVMFLISCNQNKSAESPSPESAMVDSLGKATAVEEIEAPSEIVVEEEFDLEKEVCLIQLTDASWIKENLSEVHALSDKCKENLMASLKNNALKYPKMLASIDAVNYHSQGFIKEEVWYIMRAIYEKNLPGLATYLNENQNGSLAESLMTALSMTTAEDSPDLVEDRFVKRINAEVKDEKTKQYMLSLKSMFNFQMFN